YDGFTTPLTASVNVTPCQTYHLKLAIADAGDCDYDSGVFLEYQGISCSQAQIPSVATQTTASFCDLNNGSATATVGNYTGTATYLWSPGGQT
ncbi:MAG TPA: choice-of-anchor L domain-containing protein, partial [Bacteroidia bacterium]|nr:choice-of-anchor L domain-containing protein [Bacteroidia bacterium]